MAHCVRHQIQKNNYCLMLTFVKKCFFKKSKFNGFPQFSFECWLTQRWFNRESGGRSPLARSPLAPSTRLKPMKSFSSPTKSPGLAARSILCQCVVSEAVGGMGAPEILEQKSVGVRCTALFGARHRVTANEKILRVQYLLRLLHHG